MHTSGSCLTLTGITRQNETEILEQDKIKISFPLLLSLTVCLTSLHSPQLLAPSPSSGLRSDVGCGGLTGEGEHQ